MSLSRFVTSHVINWLLRVVTVELINS